VEEIDVSRAATTQNPTESLQGLLTSAGPALDPEQFMHLDLQMARDGFQPRY
jgi:hypothetical protein